MSAQLMDGKALAAQKKAAICAEVERLARTPGLAVVLVGENPASQIYVRGKARDCEECGIRCMDFRLPAQTTESELLTLIAELNGRADVDGILVQLPLPEGIRERRVLEAIAPEKDVDAFHPENVGRLVQGQARYLPCTPAGVMELLRAAGKTVHVGGNIGHPLLCEAGEMAQTDWAVLELSSFQLMTMDLSPHIAVMTNLAPNHLDVHRDMDEYVESKANIFCHQQPGDIAVFNLDNNITRGLGGECASQVRWFSRREEPAEGVFLRGESIICRRSGQEREVLRTTDIKIPGVHNVENYMAAIAAVDGLVPDEVIRRFAREFGGVEHRIELVRTYRGVKFYNDSIASSPSRTIAGLRSFKQQVILIAGGYDKHIPFDVLGPEVVEHVKLLILCGATADKIRAAVENAPGYEPGKPEILDVTPFERAVETARDRAEEGDIVTLSPACAAFDQFKNFMERGKLFKTLVNNL